MCMFGCMHACAQTPEKVLDPQGLELKMIVSHSEKLAIEPKEAISSPETLLPKT